MVKLYNKNRKRPHYPVVNTIPDEYKNWEDDFKVAGQLVRWIMFQSHVATLLLDMEIPYNEMLEEAKAQDHLFVKHRGESSPGWSSMAIHGTAVEDTSPREALIARGKYTKENCPEYSWTSLADLCPITKEWLQSLEFNYFNRVRFMKLDPGGWIDPHSDVDVPGLHAWNVALNNPEGHKFVMDGYGFVPWAPGQFRGIDISKKHSVVNEGTEPRIHMIIHGGYGEKFVNIICRSYKQLYDQTN
jgi:hypothetical protein